MLSMRRVSKLGRRRLRRLQRDQRGVSAVEFALVAPLLVLALLGTVDIGLALHQRMTIDHVLRAGAQSAMMDRGAEQVLAVLTATAADSFELASQGTEPSDGALTLTAERYCACPADKGTAVACSTPCSGSDSTYLYYRLFASRAQKGLILPSFEISSSAQVQVR